MPSQRPSRCSSRGTPSVCLTPRLCGTPSAGTEPVTGKRLRLRLRLRLRGTCPAGRRPSSSVPSSCVRDSGLPSREDTAVVISAYIVTGITYAHCAASVTEEISGLAGSVMWRLTCLPGYSPSSAPRRSSPAMSVPLSTEPATSSGTNGRGRHGWADPIQRTVRQWLLFVAIAVGQGVLAIPQSVKEGPSGTLEVRHKPGIRGPAAQRLGQQLDRLRWADRLMHQYLSTDPSSSPSSLACSTTSPPCTPVSSSPPTAPDGGINTPCPPASAQHSSRIPSAPPSTCDSPIFIPPTALSHRHTSAPAANRARTDERTTGSKGRLDELRWKAPYRPSN
jgi:hypothetical protein